MIKNEQEYRTTLKRIERFQRQIEELRKLENVNIAWLRFGRDKRAEENEPSQRACSTDGCVNTLQPLTEDNPAPIALAKMLHHVL